MVNKIYEYWALGWSFALIAAVLFYFIFNPTGCILETSSLIRGIEICIGISLIPYYAEKLSDIFKKERKDART